MPPAAPNPRVTNNLSAFSGDALDTPLWHNKLLPNKLSLQLFLSLAQACERVVTPQHVSLVFQAYLSGVQGQKDLVRGSGRLREDGRCDGARQA